MIKSGLETMEIAKEIETSELLRRWRWYAGALQQHNYATLMLVEAFGYPGTEHAKRAWESMDWIFQVPSCVPYDHKARWVMEGAVGAMREYYKARKLRCPTLMDERLVKASSSSPTAILPKPRELAARPRKLAQSSSKGTSHSGQSRVNSHGILEDHLQALAHMKSLGRALPQTSMTSNMKTSLQDATMIPGAQATAMDGITYERAKTVYIKPVRHPTSESMT